MAPNLDRLVIVSSFGVPAYKPGLIDRLLVLSGMEDLPAILVLNKVDLAEQRSEAEEAARLYRSLGVDVIVTSTVTGEGIYLLRERVEGLSSGLVGHSGVGKSSLLRAVEPTLEGVQVGEVSHAIGKGQHTTTEVRFWPLQGPAGGRVFDLPGLKRIPLSGLDPRDLGDHFPDLASHSRGCRFDDCLHGEEPECRVKDAVGDGWIADSRYRSYLTILESLTQT